ncbi:nitroreductase family deazaflavin-dependent oxidoreductase [Kibdelosporangium persicum]|uniref:Deazaflavin-dependent nitroreductase n=1 Tax=Kibdelosporangium persicum TaxID=2698649 RepID=A0ABX2FFG6_9PSEU|nr:nitroreductase family deazaflavin-dependent oxidoreductase [Kibdelosporangium persicum]NRN69571.1 Deazaflavin-dependent nitroreductase [Kibdelosporangium persicum]
MPGLRRMFVTLGKTKAWAAVGRTLAPVDRWLVRLTGGKVGVGTAVGLRTLLLTTVGRTSGQKRQVPLLYIERDGGYVVIGSNWGGERHPAWSSNLLAEPGAVITVRGRQVAVRGRLLTGAERRQTWNAVASYWPAYDTYAERADGRKIRVFLLEPVRH